MAKFILSIETTDVAELQRIVARMPADADESPIPATSPAYQDPPPADIEQPQTTKARRGRPPKQEAPVEAAPVPTPVASAPTVEAASVQPSAPSAPGAGSAPAATAPAHPAAPPVSYDALKSLLMQLMEKKSASFAQALLKEKCGVPSLSLLKQDDYFAAYQALEQALQS